MSKNSTKKSSKMQEFVTQRDSSARSMLESRLLEAQALQRIWDSRDFQDYLLPKLKQENKWLNPQDFKEDKEFQRAYNVMWARAQAANELISLLSGQDLAILDAQKRIAQMELKNVKTTTSKRSL